MSSIGRGGACLSGSPWNPWAGMWAWTHVAWGNEHRWPSQLSGDGCDAAIFPSPGGWLLEAGFHHECSAALNCCLVHPQTGGVCPLITDFFFLFLPHSLSLVSFNVCFSFGLSFLKLCCFTGQSLTVCTENNSEVYFIRLIWIGVLVLKLTTHTHTYIYIMYIVLPGPPQILKSRDVRVSYIKW